ncbi:hypothetical protein R1sor_023736 [Riccia sorocarpa]|uniref:Uncharacterized protein n=1 Tax=Riccia sorocarpa TaxID=122646 RepID=A0ABD3GRQ3_9MARC
MGASLGDKRMPLPLLQRIGRRDKNYDSWGLHVWGDVRDVTQWDSPLAPGGVDDFGCYWDVDVSEGGELQFLIHAGREKEFEDVMDTAKTQSIWVVSDYRDVFTEKPDLASIPRGELGLARALWVTEDLLAATLEGDRFFLHACGEAKLNVTGRGVEGGSVKLELKEDIQGLPAKVVEKFPHIAGYKALRVPPEADTKGLVKCQLALSSRDCKALSSREFHDQVVLDQNTCKLRSSYETNNFGVGLPPKAKNGSKWPLMKRLLADPKNVPSKDQILAAVENLKELLKIRSLQLSLHPIQMTSRDELVKASTFDATTGTFSVPARTTAVFVEARQ